MKATIGLWYKHEKSSTSMQRRILITHWIGSAWNTLCGADYAKLRTCCWEKTGCLMTAHGSNDENITPEGLPNYRVPPPIMYLPPCEAEPSCNMAGDQQENEAEEEEMLDHDREIPEEQRVELVDNLEDRCTDDELCGRKNKALYENGWFVGNIEYGNKRVGKYRITYTDDSEDYIAADEIDGVEVVLLDWLIFMSLNYSYFFTASLIFC